MNSNVYSCSLWKMNKHSWQWALRQRMLLPSFSHHPPIPATAPHWKRKKWNKNGGEESAHPSWVDNQAANQLLAHWLCHQAWILRKDPLLCCCCLGSSLCICIFVSLCVCVCVEAWWNEMPGLGYLQGEPLHPIMWGSQQALWDQEEAASIKGRARRTGRDPTAGGEFFFFFFFK